jgi:protein SCO1/2
MRRFWPFSIAALVLITLSLLWMTQGAMPGADRLSPAAGAATDKPAIGGAFSLVDHNGKPVTSKDFSGKYMLVFFGYTHCLDICPVGLATITQALTEDKEQAAKIAPLFVSVDPARDTPAVLKVYLQHYYPGFVGLTGTKAQVEAAVKAYKVYASDAGAHEAKEHEHEHEHGGDDYLVDHSGFVYLMSPQGEYVTHFSGDISPQDMADELHKQVK